MKVVRPTATGVAVARVWEGRTVVCLASGPSVTQEDIELLRRLRARDEIRLVAINDMYLVAPFADVHYFADDRWRRRHEAGIAKAWPWASFTAAEVAQAWRAFPGQRVTITHDTARSDDGVVVMGKGTIEGLSSDPAKLNTGGNSGFQALNLVVLAGAKLIPLVGYDFGYAKGRTHSHDGHPDKQAEANYYGFTANFRTVPNEIAALGVEVINTSMNSRLKRFPMRPLGEVLGAVTA
jgi:hypothetical protein